MNNNEIKDRLSKNPFTYTKGILIETTNRCNYGILHPKCPANKENIPRTLELNNIIKIFKELGKYEFDRIIYPFCYSEPLIDPRFFKIVELAHQYIPKAKVWIYTNGFMVDEILLRELDTLGVNKICFSAYTEKESIRIRKMILKNRDTLNVVLRAYKRFPMDEKMNDKIEWYDMVEPLNLEKKCSAPLSYLTIKADGEVIMCCHDWKQTHVLGSIKESTLSDIITNDKTVNMSQDLSEGKRCNYFLCARCNKKR